MTKYLYTRTRNVNDIDRTDYILITPDPKRDGLLKATLFLNKNLDRGFSYAYGKVNQSLINELVKKSEIIN